MIWGKQTRAIPPWHSGTGLFNQPAATCELVLDGRKHSVSIVIWDGYCYLQVTDLHGLWAITCPYDQTDLPEFVANQIARGEVGKVWDFDYTPPPSPEGKPLPRLGYNPPFRLVAVVRSDNSALVREWQRGPFVETPPVSPRKKSLTQAKVPSIWSSKRQLLEKKKIGLAAYQSAQSIFRASSHDAVPHNELFTWKQGSLDGLIGLLQVFCIFAFEDKSKHPTYPPIEFHWGFFGASLAFYGYSTYVEYRVERVDVKPFLQILWNHHHFDTTNWIPVRAIHYSRIPETRANWEKPCFWGGRISVERFSNLPTKERSRAALFLRNWFKGKIDDEKIEELLS